jgi:hypothetical protein
MSVPPPEKPVRGRPLGSGKYPIRAGKLVFVTTPVEKSNFEIIKYLRGNSKNWEFYSRNYTEPHYLFIWVQNIMAIENPVLKRKRDITVQALYVYIPVNPDYREHIIAKRKMGISKNCLVKLFRDGGFKIIDENIKYNAKTEKNDFYYILQTIKTILESH